MGNSIENFKINYRKPEIRKGFELATGIKAEDNPAAFIAYINALSTDQIFRAIEELFLLVREKR